MTIETIADFAFAMDRDDIQISFPARAAASTNHRARTIEAGTNPIQVAASGSGKALILANAA